MLERNGDGEEKMNGAKPITRVSGRAVAVRGDDIDTDRIIPARYMKEVTFSRMGEYPFYDERFDASGNPKTHPFNDPRYHGASVLFVNKNFGCGSSREHAPQALYRFGIHAIVGESFAAIFAGNCVMMGMPLVTVTPAEMEQLQRAAETDAKAVYAIDLENKRLLWGERQVACEIPESHRQALLQGTWDSTGMLVGNMDKVRQVADRLPYMRGFTR
jgi:3-isopropylmalate/(R)-2-methylmalate dehydratase small subunit